MMINSKVAVIIVNWKKYDITSSCVESILNSTNSNFKIILVDNESDNKKVKKNDQLQTKGIEVGHIFYFGDKYSKPMNCSVDGKDGKKIFVKMGSYGIGVSRLVAAIIEAKFNNDKMKWPKAVSPFDVVIIPAINKMIILI